MSEATLPTATVLEVQGWPEPWLRCAKDHIMAWKGAQGELIYLMRVKQGDGTRVSICPVCGNLPHLYIPDEDPGFKGST